MAIKQRFVYEISYERGGFPEEYRFSNETGEVLITEEAPLDLRGKCLDFLFANQGKYWNFGFYADCDRMALECVAKQAIDERINIVAGFRLRSPIGEGIYRIFGWPLVYSSNKRKLKNRKDLAAEMCKKVKILDLETLEPPSEPRPLSNSETKLTILLKELWNERLAKRF